eukprot:10028343-Prorocentrum_lima.AAC.1
MGGQHSIASGTIHHTTAQLTHQRRPGCGHRWWRPRPKQLNVKGSGVLGTWALHSHRANTLAPFRQ